MILSKEYYEEYLVMIGKYFSKYCIKNNNEIEVDLKTLSELTLSKGPSGLEVFYDIPSVRWCSCYECGSIRQRSKGPFDKSQVSRFF